MKELILPLAPEQAKKLRTGDLVTVSGELFTGRSLFHIRAVENDLCPPVNYKLINCFFHTGPVMKKDVDRWQVVSCEPTSSIRFERYSAEVIRKLGLRTIIGKTTLGKASALALKDTGGVYLSKIGVSGNILRKQVKKVSAVHFLEELGSTEATWIMEVERFGPFFVAVDAEGNNYFHDLDRRVREKLTQVEKSLHIPPDYSFTDVDTGEI